MAKTYFSVSIPMCFMSPFRLSLRYPLLLYRFFVVPPFPHRCLCWSPFTFCFCWSLQVFLCLCFLPLITALIISVHLSSRMAPVMASNTTLPSAEMLLVPHQSISCPARCLRMCIAEWHNRSATLGCFFASHCFPFGVVQILGNTKLRLIPL